MLKKRPIEAKKLELGFLVLCELALEEHDATRAGDVEVWLRVLRPVLVVEQDPGASFENETINAAPVGQFALEKLSEGTFIPQTFTEGPLLVLRFRRALGYVRAEGVEGGVFQPLHRLPRRRAIPHSRLALLVQ